MEMLDGCIEAFRDRSTCGYMRAVHGKSTCLPRTACSDCEADAMEKIAERIKAEHMDAIDGKDMEIARLNREIVRLHGKIESVMIAGRATCKENLQVRAETGAEPAGNGRTCKMEAPENGMSSGGPAAKHSPTAEKVRRLAKGGMSCGSMKALGLIEGEEGGECRGKSCRKCRRKALLALAGQIEREHAEAASLAPCDDRRLPEGVEWPRFEDGDLVAFGDEYEYADGKTAEVQGIEFSSLGAATLNHQAANSECHLYVSPGGRVTRPKPDVLGADGLPVAVGDVVYLDAAHAHMAGRGAAECGSNAGMSGVSPSEELRVCCLLRDGCVCVKDIVGAWCPASWLTHERPDSREAIVADKRKDHAVYWGCSDYWCNDHCPAEIGGQKPKDHYGVRNCMIAMGMDLARRVHELGAREKGVEE